MSSLKCAAAYDTKECDPALLELQPRGAIATLIVIVFHLRVKPGCLFAACAGDDTMTRFFQ